MRKQGASDNEFVGVAWALGLFAAAGWRVVQRHAGALAAGAGCVVLYLTLSQLASVGQAAANAGVLIPPLEGDVSWRQVSPELRTWALDHTLYTPSLSDLNVPKGGPLYPNFYNIADLLAAGSQPLYLVHALLNRRFEDVEPFNLEEYDYTSAYGKWEENYLWKLDEVIAERYVAEPGLPHGVLGRRPGPERAAWMRDCFGPFTAGGVSFRIRRGGGFWCSFARDSLQLVEAPTPLSEVVATQPVQISGTMSVTLGAGSSAQVDLVLEHGSTVAWVAHVTTIRGDSRDVEITTYVGGTQSGSSLAPATSLPGGKRQLRLHVIPGDGIGSALPSGREVTALAVPAEKDTFSVVATSGVALGLNDARFTR